MRDDRCLYNFAKPCHRALIARSIAKSIQVTDKRLDCHVVDAPRNDSICHPELVSGSQNETFFSHFTSHFSRKRVAFTLAEVLITLGVIGIVAVLTLPSVINSTKDKQYKAARYKALSTIGSASKMIATQDRMNDATSVEDFVKNYLGEQINIAKTCDNDNLKYCGIPPKIKTINGDEIDMPKSALKTGQHGTETRVYEMYKDAKSYGFLTADGYSYNLFYFPKCSGTKLTGKNGFTNAMQYPCVNAIYDMNGLKGPNQVGKDIGFVTVFYPNETVQAVAPMPEKETSTGTLNYSNAQKYCAEKGKFIPNVDEAMSITLNAKLINTNLLQEYIWTTNTFKSEYGFMANFIITLYNIMLYSSHPASATYTLCIDGN